MRERPTRTGTMIDLSSSQPRCRIPGLIYLRKHPISSSTSYVTNERHSENVSSSLIRGCHTPEPTLLPASAAYLEPMEEHSPQSYRLACPLRPFSSCGFAQAVIVPDAQPCGYVRTFSNVVQLEVQSGITRELALGAVGSICPLTILHPHPVPSAHFPKNLLHSQVLNRIFVPRHFSGPGGITRVRTTTTSPPSDFRPLTSPVLTGTLIPFQYHGTEYTTRQF